MESDQTSESHHLPTLEWWPDYGSDLLWMRSGAGGSRIAVNDVGLSTAFQDAVQPWLAKYDDGRLPIDGPGDVRWIEQGIQLLAAARSELAGRYIIVVTEEWWGEPANDS